MADKRKDFIQVIGEGLDETLSPPWDVYLVAEKIVEYLELWDWTYSHEVYDKDGDSSYGP